MAHNVLCSYCCLFKVFFLAVFCFLWKRKSVKNVQFCKEKIKTMRSTSLFVAVNLPICRGVGVGSYVFVVVRLRVCRSEVTCLSVVSSPFVVVCGC